MREDQLHTATAHVCIMQDQFEMPQLGTSRRIWLYLPEGYEQSELRYPVIYMQDGQNLFDSATASFEEWRIDEYMEKVPSDKQVIIVGIDHGDSERMLEYNPYNSEAGAGKGDLYAEFLVQTLKPYIDQNYRTLSDPLHTIISGSSLGGLISMYAALKYPQIFGYAGIFSPAFWVANDLFEFARQAEGLSESRFYFACGDAESDTMVDEVNRMAAILHERGLSEQHSKVVIVAGAEHNEKQWHHDFAGFYTWLLE